MRDSLSGTWLFVIVIALIIVFTSVMSMTINRSRAYAIKEDIVAYIENNFDDQITRNSVPSGLISIIEDAGYFTTGNCNGEDWYGYDRNGNETSTNPSICIKQTYINNEDYMHDKFGHNVADVGRGCFYEIKVFYNINLPVINTVFPFAISGQTTTLYNGNCELR